MIKYISLCNIHTHTSRINTHEYIHMIKYMSLCNIYVHIYTHTRLEWPSRAFGGFDVGDDLMGRLDALSLAGGNICVSHILVITRMCHGTCVNASLIAHT